MVHNHFLLPILSVRTFVLTSIAVSHIVVDSSYRYPDALKALKIDRIPV